MNCNYDNTWKNYQTKVYDDLHAVLNQVEEKVYQ